MAKSEQDLESSIDEVLGENPAENSIDTLLEILENPKPKPSGPDPGISAAVKPTFDNLSAEPFTPKTITTDEPMKQDLAAAKVVHNDNECVNKQKKLAEQSLDEHK